MLRSIDAIGILKNHLNEVKSIIEILKLLNASGLNTTVGSTRSQVNRMVKHGVLTDVSAENKRSAKDRAFRYMLTTDGLGNYKDLERKVNEERACKRSKTLKAMKEAGAVRTAKRLAPQQKWGERIAGFPGQVVYMRGATDCLEYNKHIEK